MRGVVPTKTVALSWNSSNALCPFHRRHRYVGWISLLSIDDILLNGKSRRENSIGDILLIVIHLFVVLLINSHWNVGISLRWLEIVEPIARLFIEWKFSFLSSSVNPSLASETIQVLVRILNHPLCFFITMLTLQVSLSLSFSLELIRGRHVFWLSVVERIQSFSLLLVFKARIKVVYSISADSLISHWVRVSSLNIRRIKHVVCGFWMMRIGSYSFQHCYLRSSWRRVAC